MKIARKIIEMKPEFKVGEMISEWHHTKSISLGMRRIKKKKITITDGRMGQLPPLSLSNSLEQLPDSKSLLPIEKPRHNEHCVEISLTGRDDDVNNVTIDINNTTLDSERAGNRRVKSPTAS